MVLARAGELIGVGREERLDPRHGERGDEARCGENARRDADRGTLGVQGCGRGIRLGEERTPDEAHRVGDREHRPDERPDEGDPGPRVARRDGLEERREHGLLRHETEERRKPGHRRGGHDRDRGDHRHPSSDTGEPPRVAGARGVVDDADHEEERRLEQCVREQERDAREGGIARAESDHEHEEAELAHRAVREEELQVVLAERAPAAHEHREHTEHDDDRMPHLEVGVPGRESRDEVDARLHHRRRVQVGAHRGGRGHRRGQPEVERHERALRDRADEHERDRPLAGGARDRVCDELGERGRAACHGEDHEADEHREAAERRDGERLQRGATALFSAGVVADEEVGEHARGFPEREQDEHVVGRDEAEHDTGEREEERREPAEGGLVVGEVVHAVEEHERADASHDEREEQRERVDPEAQRDVERGDPRHDLGDGFAREHSGQPREQQHEDGSGKQGDDREDAPAEPPCCERRQERDDREGSEAGNHSPSPRSHRPPSLAVVFGSLFDFMSYR